MDAPQLQSWLALECEAIPRASAALAVLGSSLHARAAEVAAWPECEQPSARLRSLIGAVQERGRVVLQEPAPGVGGSGTTAHLALPILRGGAVLGAVGLSVCGLEPGEVKAVAERLERSVRNLELRIALEEDRDRICARADLAATLLEHDSLARGAHAVAVELASRLGCERVALGLVRDGRMQVVAVSSSLRFSEERDTVRELCAALEETAEQDAVIELPAPAGAPPHVVIAHQALLRSSGAGALCSVPLPRGGRAVGALTSVWRAASDLDAARRGELCGAALLTGPILALHDLAEASPLRRARRASADWTARQVGEQRSLAGALLLAAAALLGVLALAPATHRVVAPASLEGRVQRALVAAVPGYIAEANVRAGDVVRSGDVLARLDDRDLQLERRKWSSQSAQLEKEYREALAGEDRTRVSILGAQIAQARAQLGLVDEQLGRTRVIAPFDGIVLQGDLDRSLGSPVEQGEVLFELAPLDGYRIILDVEDRDIADVAVGEHGRLALSALPGRTLPLRVERITPIAVAEQGRNFFRVEAMLEEPSDALRPGMEGIAKIEVGRRRLLWIVTHGMLDWLRLRTWSLL